LPWSYNMLLIAFLLGCNWIGIAIAQAVPDTRSSSFQAEGVTNGPIFHQPTWEESQKCLDAQLDYDRRPYSSLSQRSNLSQRPSIRTWLSIFETIKTVGGGEHYTACDGIPRFRFTPGGITSVITSFVTATGTRIDWGSVNADPYPECKMSDEFCQEKYDIFLANSSSFEVAENNIKIDHLQKSCSSLRQCYLGFESEVVLLYWPPTIRSRDICASDGVGAGITVPVTPSQTVITTSAITFSGRDLYLREIDEEGASTRNIPQTTKAQYLYTLSSVLTGPFTLTWPTAYIAHHQIYADILNPGRPGKTDSWESKVPRRPPGIIPLHSTDLASYWHTNPSRPFPTGPEFAHAVASGRYAKKESGFWAEQLQVLPFDFGHLQDPVPAHVYFNGRNDCWDRQTHCGTITDNTYKPTLILRNKVWEDAKLGDCAKMDLNDPPIALRPISEDLETPEMPMAMPTMTPMVPVLANAFPRSKTEASRWPKETGEGMGVKSASISGSVRSAVPLKGSARLLLLSFLGHFAFFRYQL
jgi:hypothetical protein